MAQFKKRKLNRESDKQNLSQSGVEVFRSSLPDFKSIPLLMNESMDNELRAINARRVLRANDEKFLISRLPNVVKKLKKRKRQQIKKIVQMHSLLICSLQTLAGR